MNEMDLMKAMTDLEDDLLKVSTRRKKSMGVFAFLVAALILMLIASVCVVAYRDTTPNYVTNEFDLKPQKITDQLFQQISEELTSHWKREMKLAEQYGMPITQDENKNCNTRIYFTNSLSYQQAGQCFCRFCCLEKALGFPLALTQQMKNAQLKSGEILGQNKSAENISFYVDFGTAKENNAAIDSGEMLQPEGFKVWFLMGGYHHADDYVRCEILVPLTAENAELQKHYKMAHPGKVSKLKEEELCYGDTVVKLVYSTSKWGTMNRAYAYYCVDGIGYCFTAWDENGDGDARQMLLDLLDGLAEVIER